MDVYEYIDSELFILVPVLYVLGMMIKKSPVSNRFIPLILGIAGILLAAVYKLSANPPGSTSSIASLIFASITQGVLCAACSVYANNLFKQLKNKEDDDNSEDS